MQVGKYLMQAVRADGTQLRRLAHIRTQHIGYRRSEPVKAGIAGGIVERQNG